MEGRRYPAKILLFGEYTVLEGAQALAIPYDGKFGQWKKEVSFEKLNAEYIQQASAYINWLKENEADFPFLDIEKVDKELTEGWNYEADIPDGYGLGSSGAVCASFYDRYLKTDAETNNLSFIRNRLSSMESFFHGKSSGIDPLVSFTNQMILKGRNEIYVTVEQSNWPQSWGYFLVDSGKGRSTGEWVRLFKDKMQHADYAILIRNQLIPSIEHAIHFLLQGSWDMFWAHLQVISTFQRQHFSEMIPSHINPIWSEIAERQDIHQMKLCGAGGGGFFLVFSKNVITTAQMLEARIGTPNFLEVPRFTSH